MGAPHHVGLMSPSHRRRPLKSKTYSTFLRLLSLTSHPSFSSPLQDDKGSQKAQGLCSKESHGPFRDSESVRDDRKEAGSFPNMQSSLDLIALKKHKEENQGFGDIIDLVVDQGNGSDPVSESIYKPLDASCMLEVRSSSFSPGSVLKGNGELSVKEVCEAIDSSLDADATAEFLRHGEFGEQVAAVEEQNISLVTEQELQHREMEEGELPRDMVIDDIPGDMLSSNTLPTMEKEENLQAFKYSSDGEELARDVGQCETEKNKVYISLLDANTRKNDTMEVDGKQYGENQIHKSGSDNITFLETHQGHSHDSGLPEIGGGKEKPGEMNLLGHPAVASGCPAIAGDINSESVLENQSSVAAEKDDESPKNKRKRGPMTKERREKKKKKERIKRAEKNRMLGVKRLKLQPMVKPKAVSICRHYLRGRCQEGEKCKFSHDTIPLTKSTPCSHFARHSCMKGDDCPFDHQLSKYPCNNYVTKGFCSRGVDCLFSHEISPMETRPVVSYAEACEMKTSLASNSPNPSTSRKVEAKSNATVKMQSTQPPKGVNILTLGHKSANSTSKQLDFQLSKTDSGDKTVQSVSQNHQKVNEVADMAAARTPRRVNFLSFGKSPMNGSNGKVVSFSPLNRGSGNGISALATATPNLDYATKPDSQCKLMASPSSVPHGINFVSIRKSSNNCIPGGLVNHQRNEGKIVSTSIREGECAAERSNSPTVCKSASPFTFKSTAVDNGVGIVSSSKSSFLSETSPMVHKALHSTLSFAVNVEPLMKLNPSKATFGNASFHSDCANASTVLDFLYGSDCKPKT